MTATATIFDGLVSDAMNCESPAVSPSTPVADVAALVAEYNYRHVVVVSDTHGVLGILSQRDLLKHLLRSQDEDCEPGTTSVGDIINSKPITVQDGVPLLKAALVLGANRIGCLPVVDPNNRLLGTLSVADLLKHTAGSDDALETRFKIYAPSQQTRSKSPAYVRRATGSLVLPIETIGTVGEEYGFAVLGYDQESERILVKFVEDKDEGAQRVGREKENLVIDAANFISHFNVKSHGRAYAPARNGEYVVLKPK